MISENLDKISEEHWKKYYDLPQGEWNRKIEEGLWRRTQEFNTRRQSGWKNLDDKRRRMIHYLHTYDLVNNELGTKDLALIETYVWIHLCFPSSEINEYSNNIREALIKGDWLKDLDYIDEKGSHEVYLKDSLNYKLSFLDSHPEDIKQNRIYPEDYCILELTITSSNFKVPSEIQKKPWDVFNKGQRKRDFRGKPIIVDDLKDVLDYFPAQVELGCGPSIEAGIPALNFLHDVYYVTDKKENKFILGAKEDKLAYDIALNTENIYKLFTTMYKSCFFAEPTRFHKILKLFTDKNLIVGPIITNNFDGLPLKLGLEENYVRRYEEQHIIPEINFHPEAKSLIVIGSHADRRKIHAAARNSGKKLLYIDPEGYFINDIFKEYQLEDPQDGDIIFKETSVNAFDKILEKLVSEKIINDEEVANLMK